MSTTLTAIHVTKEGKELTADFEFSDAARETVEHEAKEKIEKKKFRDPLGAAADAAMMKAHGVKAHAWSIPAKPGTNFLEYMDKHRFVA